MSAPSLPDLDTPPADPPKRSSWITPKIAGIISAFAILAAITGVFLILGSKPDIEDYEKSVELLVGSGTQSPASSPVVTTPQESTVLPVDSVPAPAVVTASIAPDQLEAITTELSELRGEISILAQAVSTLINRPALQIPPSLAALPSQVETLNKRTAAIDQALKKRPRANKSSKAKSATPPFVFVGTDQWGATQMAVLRAIDGKQIHQVAEGGTFMNWTLIKMNRSKKPARISVRSSSGLIAELLEN